MQAPYRRHWRQGSPRAVEVARRSHKAAAPEVGRSPKSHAKEGRRSSQRDRGGRRGAGRGRRYRRIWRNRTPAWRRPLELTKIAGKLTEAKEKKDSLEVLLDGGSGSASSSGDGGSLKNAAALRALQKAFTESPPAVG